MNIRRIELYGSSSACETARYMLENLPQIKRADAYRESRTVVLVLQESLTEKELIPLLAHSGISGFSLR